jgi:hypothetical protein
MKGLPYVKSPGQKYRIEFVRSILHHFNNKVVPTYVFKVYNLPDDHLFNTMELEEHELTKYPSYGNAYYEHLKQKRREKLDEICKKN